jgi:predicted signal transduction protein with EAL and GGDEF domain
MLQSSSDAVIVHSTIDLGRNLGLRVVAEGVEDDLTSWLEQTATPTPEPISDSQGPTRIPRQA